MSADPELGRRRGIFMPAHEMQAYEACGWKLIDALSGMSGAGDVVLMQPPKTDEKDAA
jgi:hypothetical protein